MVIESLSDIKPRNAVAISFAISILIIILDLISPPQVFLNYLFILPVIIVGWYKSVWWAVSFSIVLPVIRLLIVTYYEPLFELHYTIINACVRSSLLLVVSYIVAKLSTAIKQIKTLEGMLPICSNCKKIRDEKQSWQPLEKYIQQHSDAKFTHGLCPECTKELFGEYVKPK